MEKRQRYIFFTKGKKKYKLISNTRMPKSCEQLDGIPNCFQSVKRLAVCFNSNDVINAESQRGTL